MKDQLGHGSDGRDGGTFNKRQQIGFGNHANFSGRKLLGASNPSTPTQRTVSRLREQLRTAGPGHQSALMQGLRNILGS